MGRRCSRCGELSDTGKSWCRECHAAYCRQWNAANKEKRAEITRKYYEGHKEQIAEWYAANREHIAARKRTYYLAHRPAFIERSKIQRKIWQASDLEGYRAYYREAAKQWRSSNSERAKATQAASEKRRWRSDGRYRVARMMRNRIVHTLKRYASSGKCGRTWESLVGYTGWQLVTRLKQTMPLGYTWDDFLAGRLHVDHIIPIAAFNFRSTEDPDFKRCWALENLQLLPAQENRKKGAKLSKPLQPSLSFA